MGIRNSEQLVQSQFTTDQNGNPTGGRTTMKVQPGGSHAESAMVVSIHWQDGVVGDDGQNGAFVEDVIEAARQRIQFFNSHPQFRCRENSLAITKLEEALQWLDWRTRNRLTQGVENSYERHDD
jgi:hypothetical protein